MQGSGRDAPVRAGVPPPPRALPARTCHRDAGGAPGWARLAGPGARGGACSRRQDGARRPGPAGRAGRGRGREPRPPPARRPRAPLLLPAPRTGRRGWGRPGRRRRAAGRGPRSGFRAATGAGTGRRGRRAADSAPGHRTGPPSALPLCPGPENPAPSRPFERWILLTYLAALASRVESWVLPDLTGLVFVTLGQPRILPELGECASAPREPSCPPMPRPGVAAPARAFCHVRHRAAFSLHFLRAFQRCLLLRREFLPSSALAFSGLGLCSVCLLVCRLKPDYCSG